MPCRHWLQARTASSVSQVSRDSDDTELRDLQQQALATAQTEAPLGVDVGDGVPIHPVETYKDFERAVALKVRQLRQERAWSQDDLAERMTRLGFPMRQTTVAKLEGTRRPIRAAEVYALAAAFGLPLEALWYVRVPAEPMAIEQMRDELQRADEMIRETRKASSRCSKTWMTFRERRNDVAEAINAAAVRRQSREDADDGEHPETS